VSSAATGCRKRPRARPGLLPPRRLLVAGLVNLETTLRIDGFPLEYQPVHYAFHAIRSSISGVGFNLAKALTRLGNHVAFLTLLGDDASAALAEEALRREEIALDGALRLLSSTPQSVIHYDATGRRRIDVDLKTIQETPYPIEAARRALEGCELAVIGNINFSRPLIAEARRFGIPIATDLHALADPEDAYNRDYLENADILFMSHERLPCPPEEWIARLTPLTRAGIIVIGMGGDGALLFERKAERLERFPAVTLRPVVSTIGAGDALFSSFLHIHLETGDARRALDAARRYAAWKIGEAGAADGLLTAKELDALLR
jgi:ribokinase